MIRDCLGKGIKVVWPLYYLTNFLFLSLPVSYSAHLHPPQVLLSFLLFPVSHSFHANLPAPSAHPSCTDGAKSTVFRSREPDSGLSYVLWKCLFPSLSLSLIIFKMEELDLRRSLKCPDALKYWVLLYFTLLHLDLSAFLCSPPVSFLWIPNVVIRKNYSI